MLGFFKGRVSLRVEGVNLARFVNMAARGGVSLEHLEKHTPHSMSATVSVRDFFRLRPIARSAHCSMRITGKQGFPFVRTKLRRRPVLLVGMLAAAVLIWQLSLHVWMVSIEGCERVDPALVSEILDAYGMTPGARASALDLRAAENDILNTIPDIAWVGLRITGVRLVATVNETTPEPPVIDRGASYDILADRDAVIESITVLDGTARVKPGDKVYKGDVLIEGVAVRTGGLQRMHALGEVVGRTTVSASAEAALYTTVRTPSGATAWARMVETPFGVFPPQPPVPFAHYDTVIYTYGVADMFIPVRLHYAYYYEVTVSRRARDMAEAEREASRKGYDAAFKLVPDNASIIDKTVNFVHIKEGVLTAECVLELLENIGVESGVGW